MFSVHATLEEFKNAATITGPFGFVLEENFDREIVTPSLSKSSVFKMFSVHTKTQGRRFQTPLV